jgi:hypothetical protein
MNLITDAKDERLDVRVYDAGNEGMIRVYDTGNERMIRALQDMMVLAASLRSVIAERDVFKANVDILVESCENVMKQRDSLRAALYRAEEWKALAARNAEKLDLASKRGMEAESALSSLRARCGDVEGIEAAICRGESNHEISHEKGESYRSCAARAVSAWLKEGK